MMLPSQHGMQISSDGVALMLSGVALAVLLHTRLDSWARVSASAYSNQPSIEVSVQTEAAATPSAPAPPSPPQKPRLHRVTPPVRVAEVAVPAEPQPQAPASLPEGAAVVASGTLPAPAADSRPDLEAEYAAGLRADINRRTHAPDSAQYRLHRPSGEVRVGFVLTRNGEAKAVRVLRSSGSPILDDAALSTVSSGHYPPMPPKAFAGEVQHMFAVTIEYHRAN
jgi:periplasmic protein TonB